MAYLLEKIENEIIDEDEEVTEIKENGVFDITTRPDPVFKQGYLTHNGVELEDGSIAMERQKPKKSPRTIGGDYEKTYEIRGQNGDDDVEV